MRCVVFVGDIQVGRFANRASRTRLLAKRQRVFAFPAAARLTMDDDRQGRITGGDEGQTDDIGLARAPVAVEQGGSAFPVHVARTVYRSGAHGAFPRLATKRRNEKGRRTDFLWWQERRAVR